MRIVYLHQYFVTPSMTGGTRSFEMARRMVEAGHEVHMVTTRTDGKLQGGWTRETIAGINVHWLPVLYDNSMGTAKRLSAFAKFAIRSGPYAARLEPEIIFATSTPLTICIPAIVAKWKQRVPMVFEVRDLWPEVPIAVGALNFPFSQPAARFLEKIAYRNSDRIIALSDGMAAGVVKTGYPDDQITVIPNSSDTDMFDIGPERGLAFRAERPWLKDRPLLAYAGTFGHVNGIRYMVELARRMAKINPEFRFLAVGKGAEERKIRSAAEGYGLLGHNFFMEPAAEKSAIPAVLSAATIASSFFINLPELEANSANKFFDALAAHRPVALNYGGWQADILAETGAGLRLPYDDLDKAATSLNAFVSDRAKMQRAREAAGKLAYGRFSRDVLARQLIDVLETAVSTESDTQAE